MIYDLSALQDALKAVRREIVIHMVLQPLVRYSYSNPVETYQTKCHGYEVHLFIWCVMFRYRAHHY